MIDDLLVNIKTIESSMKFREEIDLLMKSLYLGKNDFMSVLKTKVRSVISEHITEIISEQDINLEKLFNNLLVEVNKIPIVRLVLAYEPSEDEIERYHSFLVDACGKCIFIDLGYSPEIIGGAIIIYNGIYRDFSFRQIFEKEISNQQEYILKLLNK